MGGEKREKNREGKEVVAKILLGGLISREEGPGETKVKRGMTPKAGEKCIVMSHFIIHICSKRGKEKWRRG